MDKGKKKLAPIGFDYYFTSKEGGGAYTVIGHINCPRCNTIIEDREWSHPSKKQRKNGHYYKHYSWCYHCGLFTPDLKSKTFINPPIHYERTTN